MHLVTLATSHGQQTLLRTLDLPEPPKFFDFTLSYGRWAAEPLNHTGSAVVTRPQHAITAFPQSHTQIRPPVCS